VKYQVQSIVLSICFNGVVLSMMKALDLHSITLRSQMFMVLMVHTINPIESICTANTSILLLKMEMLIPVSVQLRDYNNSELRKVVQNTPRQSTIDTV